MPAGAVDRNLEKVHKLQACVDEGPQPEGNGTDPSYCKKLESSSRNRNQQIGMILRNVDCTVSSIERTAKHFGRTMTHSASFRTHYGAQCDFGNFEGLHF